MNTQKSQSSILTPRLLLGRSTIVPQLLSNQRPAARQRQGRTRASGQISFDLNPQWKSKHLAYTIKPKNSGQSLHSGSLMKQSRQTRASQHTNSMQSGNNDQRRNDAKLNEINRPFSGFKHKYTSSEQKYFQHNTPSHLNPQTKSKPSTPTKHGRQSYLGHNLNKIFLEEAYHFLQSQSPHSEQRGVTKLSNQFSNKESGQRSTKATLKRSTFDTSANDDSKMKPKNQKKCAFLNMKTVQSEAQQEDCQEIGQSIVITKCMPSQINFTGITMCKSQLGGPDCKKSNLCDKIRRKTAGHLRDYTELKKSVYQ